MLLDFFIRDSVDDSDKRNATNHKGMGIAMSASCAYEGYINQRLFGSRLFTPQDKTS